MADTATEPLCASLPLLSQDENNDCRGIFDGGGWSLSSCDEDEAADGKTKTWTFKTKTKTKTSTFKSRDQDSSLENYISEKKCQFATTCHQ